MKTRMERLGVVVAVCAGFALTASVPAASAATVKCAAITGSGSSLQNLAQKEIWSPTWEKAAVGSNEGWEKEFGAQKCETPASVVYTATSSGKGLAEWGAKEGIVKLAEAGNGKEELDSFVGTDVGPEGSATTGQIGHMDEAGKSSTENNAVTAVPVAQSAVSVIVSLPVGCALGKKNEKARISNQPLEEEWNTDTIGFDNLVTNVGIAVAGCESTPVLEARETASGTTAGFKRYLDDLEPAVYGPFTETAEKSESQAEWPELANKNEAGNKTGGELAKKVYETPGTIGYADLADARNAGFTGVTPHEHTNGKGEKYYSFFVQINNGGIGSTSEWESPEFISTGAANCSKASYPEPAEVAPNVDWSKAKQGNATVGGTTAYSICTLTFDVAWQHYSFVKAEKANKEKIAYTSKQSNTVFDYLAWLVSAEGQGQAALTSGHFAPLPAKIRQEAEKGVVYKNLKF